MAEKFAFGLFSFGIAAIACAVPTSASQAAVGDTITTQRKVVSEIVIQAAPSGNSYYVTAEGGWESAGCPGAIFAYIDRSTPGADAVLSAAITARSTGKPIGFDGICGDTSGQPQYIQIRTVHF